MDRGNSFRSVGATLMNAGSSRSHSIFMVNVETAEPDPTSDEGKEKVKAGRLNLVDLAGSERQSKTQAEGARLKEATKINMSLSALGNVTTCMGWHRATQPRLICIHITTLGHFRSRQRQRHFYTLS